MFSEKEMAQLRRLEILAAKVRKGELRGERESARQGPGSGFRGHRAYREGDALRTVDWHVYARMDALVVKEFDAEEALEVLLVHDRSASMAGAAAELAARVVAGLGAVALAGRERVRWLPAGGPPRGSETFLGRPRLPDLIAAARPAASGRTDLAGALARNLPRRGRGGVAFVVSDFFDPGGATRALARLLARRYQVRAILVEDSAALAPPPLGRTRLHDRETGERLTLEIAPDTIAAYERAKEARVQGIAGFLRRHGAGFLRARASQPFFEVVRASIARGWLSS